MCSIKSHYNLSKIKLSQDGTNANECTASLHMYIINDLNYPLYMDTYIYRLPHRHLSRSNKFRHMLIHHTSHFEATAICFENFNYVK